MAVNVKVYVRKWTQELTPDDLHRVRNHHPIGDILSATTAIAVSGANNLKVHVE